MKTTNLEISKKLKEIGFKKPFYFYWSSNNNFEKPIDIYSPIADGTNQEEFVPAYDLETLLEVLPQRIHTDDLPERYKTEYFRYYGGDNNWDDIYYVCFKLKLPRLKNVQYELKYSNETNSINCYKFGLYNKEHLNLYLADLVGLMLIELHKDKLIKFGGQNE